MDRLLIDTNVIIRHLRSADGILSEIIGGYKLCISAVTVAEILASKRAANQVAADQVLQFLQENFEIIPVTKDVAVRTGELLRDLEIAYVHASIAATAINEDIPLVTYEIKTFDNIPDLKIVDI